jgi:hypothetical protein
MSNAKGSNQFQRENPYGAVKKLTQLTRSAPMSGAPTPAVGAPKRAQRRAVRGGGGGATIDSALPPSAPPREPSYQAQIAEVWRTLSAYTDDPLVHEYAALAQQQSQT